MSISRILGIILLVVGIVCLCFGVNASNTAVDEIAEATTGRFTQETMWYIIGGIAMILGGASLFMGGRPRS